MLTRLLMLLAALLLAAAAHAADRVETTTGDVFVGKFEKLEGGEVHFTSDSAGLVKIAVAKVKSVTLEGERETSYRTEGDVQNQQKGQLFTRGGVLIIRTSAGELALDNLSGVQGINETVPDERPQWNVSALGTFAWTEGNTRTYALGYRFDIKRTTRNNYMTLFGSGSYLQDRDLEEEPVRERKHHIGYLYRYIFDFKLTIDVTEDLYFNEFAGYHWRSITGIGPGYYILKEDKLNWHVGLHAIYVYEDQMNGAEDRGYFGARATTELDWVTQQDRLHLNFKTHILFDFDEFKNVNVYNSLLVEYKFMTYLTAGVLMEHYFDNLPPEDFRKHDFRLMLTLGISWSGRWY